jgi:hypothetical protein
MYRRLLPITPIALAFLCSLPEASGQVNAQSFARMVADRVPENEQLLHQTGDLSDSLMVAYRKLERAIPDELREQIDVPGYRSAWREIGNATTRTDQKLQLLSRSLQKWVKADELFLRTVQPGSIDVPSILAYVFKKFTDPKCRIIAEKYR